MKNAGRPEKKHPLGDAFLFAQVSRALSEQGAQRVQIAAAVYQVVGAAMRAAACQAAGVFLDEKIKGAVAVG